jgi:hypothetical protein
VGCFTGTAEGVRAGALNGRAVYRLSADGELLIVLLAPGRVPIALTIGRDSGGIPAHGGDLVVGGPDEGDGGPQGSPAALTAMMSGISAGLDSLKAAGVDVAGAQRGLSPDSSGTEAVPTVQVGIAGGVASDPVWMIPAESGSLHLVAGSGGVLIGTFEVSGEGRELASGDPVTITVRGSFRAERRQ